MNHQKYNLPNNCAHSVYDSKEMSVVSWWLQVTFCFLCKTAKRERERERRREQEPENQLTKWTDSEDYYRGEKKQSIQKKKSKSVNKMLNVRELSTRIGLFLESTMDGMHNPQCRVTDNSVEI